VDCPDYPAVFWQKWLVSMVLCVRAGRDQIIKLWDLRYMREVQTFRGHKKEITSMEWHPIYETLFVSGSFDGTLKYWITRYRMHGCSAASFALITLCHSRLP